MLAHSKFKKLNVPWFVGGLAMGEDVAKCLEYLVIPRIGQDFLGYS
jgi:hypothetical protein